MRKYRILIERDGFSEHVYVQDEKKNIFGIRVWKYLPSYRWDYVCNREFDSVENAKTHINKLIIPKTQEIIYYP